MFKEKMPRGIGWIGWIELRNTTPPYNKFYKISIEESTGYRGQYYVTVRYGRIGTRGRAQQSNPMSWNASMRYINRKLNDRYRHGYTEFASENPSFSRSRAPPEVVQPSQPSVNQPSPRRRSKKWGIGIEHEFYTTTDTSGNAFNISAPAPHGSYASQNIVYTSKDRIVNLRRDTLREGEKKLVAVASDPSVPGGYEINTLQPFNKTIEDQLKKLQKAEKKIVSYLPNGNKRRVVFPFGSVGTRTDVTSGSTPGSYHLHLTLPHKESMTDEEKRKYSKGMTRFMKQLQWLEPLIVSTIGGASPEGVGDFGREPEGSIRMGRAGYGSIGTSPPNWERIVGRRTDITPEWMRGARIQGASRYPHADFSKLSDTHLEIRFMDQFDSSEFDDLLRMIVYTASNAVDQEDAVNPDRAGTNDVWNKTAAKVLEEGYNAYLSKSYIEKLWKSLGFPSETMLKSRRACDVMQKVSEELWKKNKSNEISKLLVKNRRSTPKVYNINRASWNYWFKRKLRMDSGAKSKFKKLGETLTEISENPESESDFIVSGTQYVGFKQIVEKDMGKGFSSEDHRDLVDFMELNNLLKVKRKPDGSVKWVKPLYTSKNQNKKFNRVINDKSFFKDESIVRVEEVEEVVERPSERPRPLFNVGDYAKFRWRREYIYLRIDSRQWNDSNNMWRYGYTNHKDQRGLAIQENLVGSTQREFNSAVASIRIGEERLERERIERVREEPPRRERLRTDRHGRIITDNINTAASNPSRYVFVKRKEQPGWFKQSKKHREARFKGISNQKKRWRKLRKKR